MPGPALHREESFFQGDTFVIFGALRYADGTPFNLAAGAAVAWTLKNAAGEAVLSYSITGGQVSVSSAAAGTITITIPAGDSASLPPGRYGDACVATDPHGYVSTQWIGTLCVKPKP